MAAMINRLFDLREGEAGPVLTLAFLLFANTVGRQMGGIVGIADVINIGGANQTLIVNAINGVLILITAALSSLIVDKFNRKALLQWTCFAFALIFLIIRMVDFLNIPDQFNAALVYLMSQQQWLVFPIFFWVLATDIFEVSQAKRLIPVIGAWSFIAKLVGIGVTILPRYLYQAGIITINELTLEIVLLTNIGLYLICFAVIAYGLRKIELRDTVQPDETLQETLSEGWDFVKQVESYRYLLIAVVCILICDVVLEFRFYTVAKDAITDGAEYKQFYAIYLLVAAVISFLMQSFITSRVINWLQLRNVFLIQPIVAVLTTLSMIAAAGSLIIVAPASAILKIFRNTIDESSQKAFQGLVPEERRGRVATFLDSYAPGAGLLLGSLIAGGAILLSTTLGIKNDFYIYLAITVVVTLIAVWSVMQMRRVYDASLFNWRLKRRKRISDVLDKLDFD
jgi:ATP/ADP translocase